MHIGFGAIIAIAIIILALVTFTKTGKRLKVRAKGMADNALAEDASTSSGAKAYYASAIQKKQEDYMKATNLLAEMKGKRDTIGKDMFNLKKVNVTLETNIRNFVNSNKEDMAKKSLQTKLSNDQKIETYKTALAELDANIKTQEDVVNGLKDTLDKLKDEKDQNLLKLQMAETSDALHAMTYNSNETDEMLEKVRDGIKAKTEKATGNRLMYESSPEALQRQIDKEANSINLDAELAKYKS